MCWFMQNLASANNKMCYFIMSIWFQNDAPIYSTKGKGKKYTYVENDR